VRDLFITRRRLMAVLGISSAGALVAACGAAAPTPAPAKPAEPAKPSAPAAAPAAAPTNTPAPAAAAKPADPAAAKPDPNAVVKVAAEPTKPAPAAAAPAAPGKVSGKVFWLVRSTPQENKGQETIFEPIIKEKLPNVQIERVIVPGAQYIPKINSMAAAKESLEIWGFGGNYFDYWARGLPQDLTSYISGDSWDVNNFFGAGLADVFKVKGKNYGIPQLTTYGSIMVYNKDMLDKNGIKPPPVKWDDNEWTFDKATADATKMTKNYGRPDGEYGWQAEEWALMTAWPYKWGGDAWLKEHYTDTIAQKTNFNTPEVIDAHQYMQDLIWKHKVNPDPGVIQGLSALQTPFKTGKIGYHSDGGWLFWTTSDIKEFKVGYAALPKVKSNKHINFTDFWIMGRWAQNKDGAWQVIRAISTVDAHNKYSVQSGTPPTPRESVRTWLEATSKFSGQSVDDLLVLVTGAIDPKIAQESPDHLFLQHPKISTTYENEIRDPIRNNQGTAKDVIAKSAKVMDDTVKGIYDQFKDSLPKD
jgi:multiple sugar transport system substrate-binding protein